VINLKDIKMLEVRNMKLDLFLIVEGEKLEVMSVDLHKGEVVNVMAKLSDGKYSYFNDLNFADTLVGVLPTSEKEQLLEGLYDHLDKEYTALEEKLSEFAMEAMSSTDEGLPFDNVMRAKKEQFKEMETRMLGFLDAAEEVKAFLEGYYANQK